MLRFSMFGGHQGRLGPGREIYITVFGGSNLTRWPVATHLVRTREQASTNAANLQYAFLTFCGGVDLLWPTLAEEYVALRDALRDGGLTLEEWDRRIARSAGEPAVRVASFSLFGGFDGDALPSEERELDDLSLHRHLGNIPEQAVQILLPAIGQKGVLRLAVVRQAMAATLSGGG